MHRSDAVLASLEGLGLARDVAQVLLAQAKTENPGLSALDLVATIIGKLRERRPEVKPLKRRRNQEKAAMPARPIDPADLRVIVSAGVPAGATAYDGLLAAGAVKPPLRDIAV